MVRPISYGLVPTSMVEEWFALETLKRRNFLGPVRYRHGVGSGRRPGVVYDPSHKRRSWYTGPCVLLRPVPHDTSRAKSHESGFFDDCLPLLDTTDLLSINQQNRRKVDSRQCTPLLNSQ